MVRFRYAQRSALLAAAVVVSLATGVARAQEGPLSGPDPAAAPKLAAPDLNMPRTTHKLVVPECVAAKPALATTGNLARTASRLAAGGILKILAIGSSTTAGVGTSSPKAAYPARLEAEIERMLPSVDVVVTVSGVGGETAVQTISRLEREVADSKPDLVIWQVGTNDALSDVREDDFRSLVERGIAATTAAGADLILLDQQFFPSLRRKARYERFVQIVTDAGMKKRACVFGRYALMKEWGEESNDTLKAMLSGDGFHMSDRGHACMARILADEIVKASFTQVHASGAI
jgi:acyl-CoA thioesterase I